MIDEEMAEEWVKENMDCCRTDNSVNQPIPYFSEEERCVAKSAFLAGLKAGRPQWHTPDVPTRPINKVVFGYIKYYNSKLPCLVGWNGEWWYDAGTCNKKVKLIAWCEIPTFEKEKDIKSEMFPEITLPKGSAELVDKVIADAEKRLKESE